MKWKHPPQSAGAAEHWQGEGTRWWVLRYLPSRPWEKIPGLGGEDRARLDSSNEAAARYPWGKNVELASRLAESSGKLPIQRGVHRLLDQPGGECLGG